MISKELDLKNNDKYYLAIILLLSTVLTIFYINFTVNIGIFCTDVYVYLTNGLYYAGTNINADKDLWLTPLICILTSFFFDLGFKSDLSIFIVTGVLAIVGNIGLYLLFRFKFNEVLSFLGVIIYSTFSLNLIWLANGSLDIPAVSLTIWTVVFALIAMNKNPKYYIWAIVMFLLAFLVRYTVILVLPPLLLYFLFKKKYRAPWDELKYFVIPIGLFIGLTIVAIAIMWIVSGMPQFLQEGFSFLGGDQGSSTNPAYDVNLYYYGQNFFNFLSCSNITFYKHNPQLNAPTIIAAAYGIILLIGGIITVKDNKHTDIRRKFIISTVLLAIITTISFVKLGSSITIILMLLTLISARKIFKSPKFDLNIMFLCWMLINFIFFSYLHFKVNRYFIPALPAVAYFIVYGIYKIQSKVKINKYIIPVVITIILLFTAFNLVNEVTIDDPFNAPKVMADYIINEIPDYKDAKIASNTVRPYKWYLEKSIVPVRTSDIDRLYDENITYYILNKPMNLTDYELVKDIDGAYLYKNNNF